MQTEIEVEFKKIIFQTDNFGIFAVKNGLSAKGNIIHSATSLLNVPIKLTGRWVNGKYGSQFEFISYQILGEELYFFLTRVLKGIPKKTAKEITAKIKNFNELMEKHPSRLKDFKGIGEKNYKKIVESWGKYKHLKELSELLSPYGITSTYISKIYEKFEDKSVKIIKDNPYRLTEIKGIGFKRADELARKLGKPADSIDRIKSCIEYCLAHYMVDNGHTLLPITALQELSTEESKVVDEEKSINFTLPEELFMKSIENLKMEERVEIILSGEDRFVTLPAYCHMEKWIYDTLKREKERKNSPLLMGSKINDYIASVESSMGIRFSDEQRESIRITASGQKIIAISGYAGCGKTTVSKAVLKLFERNYGHNSIVCCALSGVAANRIKSATGYESFTIHSLIKYGNKEEMHNKNNPLPYKVVVLDEASMVDVEMFYRLMNAIDFNNTTFIMIGDNGQLPPVGAGAIYSNILEYGLAKNVMLTKIYRQSEDQAIVLFANDIRQGIVPDGYNSNNYSDFTFIDKTPKNYWALKKSLKTEREKKELRVKINQSIVQEIQNICLQKREQMHSLYNRETAWDYISFLQIASPMKKGDLGVDNLNIFVQSILNPKRDNVKEIQIGNVYYRQRDKILHLTNQFLETIEIDSIADYISGKVEPKKRKVFNGQMGILIDIDFEDDVLFVYYPFENYVAIYYKENFVNRDVGLGYAMSIHKLQGNEAKNFIMAISWSHFIMLNAKLLYTGITRARDKIWIIGEKGAFEKGCKKIEETKRLTLTNFWEMTNVI